jgi:hypothetical protein
MTNPQLASVLAGSLLSKPTQLGSQQTAPPYEDGKPDDLQYFHQDCARKITMQRMLGKCQIRKKKQP